MKKFALSISAAVFLIGASGLADAAEKVTFGSIRVPVQVFVGIKKGFFSEQGLDVEVVFFKSGSEIAPALATDHVDAAFTTSGAALFNGFARGANMTIVAEALALEPNSPGGDPTAIIVRSDLVKDNKPSAADLKGKSIAVTAPGQILDIIVQTYLKKNGLGPADVKIVGTPMPDMVPAMSNGVLDAGVAIDPFLSMLVKSGKAQVLAHSADIMPNASQAFLAFSDGLMKRHAAAVQFVRGYVKTNQWMRAALKTPEGRKEIAEIFQEYVPAKSAEAYEQIAIGTASEDAKVNVDGEYGLKWQLKMLTEQGLIKGDPKLDTHINTDLLKEASGH